VTRLSPFKALWSQPLPHGFFFLPLYAEDVGGAIGKKNDTLIVTQQGLPTNGKEHDMDYMMTYNLQGSTSALRYPSSQLPTHL
jgi:hypothetical protein